MRLADWGNKVILRENTTDCVDNVCVTQVPDGATVALVPRNTKHHLHDSHDYMPGESRLF